MKKNPNHRTSIIGAGEVGYAISVDMDKNNIHQTNSSFWDTKVKRLKMQCGKKQSKYDVVPNCELPIIFLKGIKKVRI